MLPAGSSSNYTNPWRDESWKSEISRTRRTFGSVPVNSEQLELLLDWGVEPWNGFTPRSLVKANAPGGRLPNVDKSRRLPEAARRMTLVDPAQLTLFLKGNSNG